MDDESPALPRTLPEGYKGYSLEGVPRGGGFERVHEYASRIREEVKLGRGLFLSGPNGVGKTGALAVIHKLSGQTHPRWASWDRLWCCAHHVGRLYERGKWDSEASQSIDELLENAPWLVIDDLGRERKSAMPAMANLLDVRLSNKLVTSYTTNLRVEDERDDEGNVVEPSEIRQVYGDRFVSRLASACVVIGIEGADRRLATAGSDPLDILSARDLRAVANQYGVPAGLKNPDYLKRLIAARRPK
jgi:DNA replication protein DnaC